MEINNRGFTLVELLAVMVIIGIVMAVTIPNISGISTQNKKTAYAEDAKKFKNTAEYMFRSDDTIKKPKTNGQCVVVNLKYVHGNEFDNPPYGGKYLMDKSFVVMVKKNNRYKYFIQLVEKYSADGVDNYKGFILIEYEKLEGDKYLEEVTEGNNMEKFVKVDLTSAKSNVLEIIRGITGCNDLLEVYYTA